MSTTDDDVHAEITRTLIELMPLDSRSQPAKLLLARATWLLCTDIGTCFPAARDQYVMQHGHTPDALWAIDYFASRVQLASEAIHAELKRGQRTETIERTRDPRREKP